MTIYFKVVRIIYNRFELYCLNIELNKCENLGLKSESYVYFKKWMRQISHSRMCARKKYLGKPFWETPTLLVIWDISMHLVSGCSFCTFWDLFQAMFCYKATIWFKTNIRFRISVKNWVDLYMLWIILRKKFFFQKSLYSPSGMVWSKMTIFSITQPFLDGSFSSSNST